MTQKKNISSKTKHKQLLRISRMKKFRRKNEGKYKKKKEK